MVIRLLCAFAFLGAIGCAVGWLLGLLQNFHPAFDSFSHFRLHFLGALIFLCAVLLIAPEKKTRIISMVIVVLGGGWLMFEFSKGPPDTGTRGDIRLVQFNLNFRNQIMDRVGRELVAYDADVVLVQEVPPAHEAVLRGLAHYPHQAHCFFRPYVGGVSILSKHPLSAIDCMRGQGMVTALVDFPGGAATVASIHTFWPWPMSQHEQIAGWSAKLQEKWGPMIVAGDFNAAPWSHAVTKVAQASRTRVVPGIRMTIDLSLYSFLPPLPIPIDHALLSDDLCASSARVGEALGSDHYPVLVEIERLGDGDMSCE